MASSSQTSFRLLVWGFAGLLVLQAVWLVPVELFRPKMPYFPTDQTTAQRAKINRGMAGIAARVGRLRGDLWTDAAMSSSAEVIGSLLHFNGAPTEKDYADTEQAALRAARLSPHDARAWLILAAAALRPGRTKDDVAEPLKMSYYTGADDPALMPLRLRVATRSEAMNDDELQLLVAQDIRAVVLRHAELKTDIINAYRDASPVGQQFIETSLAKLDPALLDTVRRARRDSVPATTTK
jgi:hypothetical protein